MVSLLPTKFHEILFSNFRGVALTSCFSSKFREFLSSKGHNSHKIQAIKFPGNMHNYIWCPYYLPSFMKFCSVVSEELRWQTVWRTDEQDKNNMSPHFCGGRHKNLTLDLYKVIYIPSFILFIWFVLSFQEGYCTFISQVQMYFHLHKVIYKCSFILFISFVLSFQYGDIVLCTFISVKC
jgi:hypothetical protein